MSFPLPLHTHFRDVGPLVYGCMALGGDWNGGPLTEADIAQAHAAVEAALAIGIKLFDHVDILLLHRPDPLMQPAEVARAFGRLKAAGKVGHLGVSNMHAGQMRWL